MRKFEQNQGNELHLASRASQKWTLSQGSRTHHIATGEHPEGVLQQSNQQITTAALSEVNEAIHSPGQPLEPETRSSMEKRFGHDFGRVRVHVDAKAAKAAESVGAQAFTVGRDISFAAGRYTPNSLTGRQLIAHELTHVIQQGFGKNPEPVSASNEMLEEEADKVAKIIPHAGLVKIMGSSAPRLSRQVRSRQETLYPPFMPDAEIEEEIQAIDQWLLTGTDALERVRLQKILGELKAEAKRRKPAKIFTKPTPIAGAFNEKEAAEIQKRYQAETSVEISETSEYRESVEYYEWKQGAKAMLKEMLMNATKEQKKETKEKIKKIENWISNYEKHELWKFLKKDKEQEPLAPGSAPEDLVKGKYTKTTPPKKGGGAPTKEQKEVGAPPAQTYRKKFKYTVSLPGVATKYKFTDYFLPPGHVYLTNISGIHTDSKNDPKYISKKTDEIFDAAGVSNSTTKKVMMKVSGREGGFGAINTYDPGYVSIGFIQFTTRKTGKGSLKDVLRRAQTIDPEEYVTYFRSLGITADRKEIIVVDSSTGKSLHGEEAVQAIINDKRLTAVFHRAGLESRAFQVAQVKIAYEQYYFADKDFSIRVASLTDNQSPDKPTTYYYGEKGVKQAKAKVVAQEKQAKKKLKAQTNAAKGNPADPGVPGTPQNVPPLEFRELASISGKYRDILSSEAGKTALMDRAVQRGPRSARAEFEKACIRILQKYQLTTLGELAKYESAIIFDKEVKEKPKGIQNRIEVLNDTDLTQPPPVPGKTEQSATSKESAE